MARSAHVLLILSLLYRLTLVLGMSIQSPRTNPGSDSLPEIIVPSHPFNASISSSIPGFSIDLRFREDRPANPVQMYSSILFLMSKVFQYAWENTVPGEIYYGTSMWDLSIFCSPNTQLRQLRAMHVFHALLDIGNTIATSRQFFEFQCGLLLHGQNIGNVTLKRPGPWSLAATGANGTEDTLSSAEKNNSNSNLLFSGKKGTYIDPYDSERRINYEETYRAERIDVSEIFTAVLDGMFVAAPYPRYAKGVAINGVSVSGGSTINLHGLGTPPLPFSWAYAARVLSYLFYFVMVQERLFMELDFDVESGGVQIAKGFVFKLPPIQNNVTGITAISRRQISALSGL